MKRNEMLARERRTPGTPGSATLARLEELPQRRRPSGREISGRKPVARKLWLPLLGMVLALEGATCARAAAVTYTAANVTGSQWRYDYTLSGSYTAGQDLAIYFPYTTSSSLTDLGTGSSSWTTFVLQPDTALSANGEFDMVANSNSPSLTPTFSVTFLYSGTGTPAAQNFTLYDPSFTVVQAGTTSAAASTVPEPGSLPLLGLGILLACTLRFSNPFRWRKYRRLSIPVALVIALLAAQAALHAQRPPGGGGPGGGTTTPLSGFSIGPYVLQSSSRYSQYQYDYTYTTTAVNSNATSYSLVEGAVTSSSPNTVVVQPTVLFGDVAGNATAPTRTTFTIRQDRRYPFDPASLTWTFTGTASSSNLGTTPSAVNLTASSSSVSYGTGVDLTATVSPAGTGTVTFYDTSTPLGTATVSAGIATLSGFVLPTGIHVIRATYGGDTIYASSYSNQSTVTVATGGSAAACAGLAQTPQMVCLTNAFLGTLSSAQQTAVQYTYTLQHVTRWSNLPVGAVPRNGLRFGDLNSTQLAAVFTLLQPILSAEGIERLQRIRGADETISPLGGTIMWGAANYYIAIYGTPSTTTPWMLQISGHHYDLNRTFNGLATSASPFFIGADPPSYIVQDTLYTPLAKQFAAMNALGRTLLSNSDALLSGTFDDVVIGPDQDLSGNVTFPRTYPTGTTNRGVLASTLSTEQQGLIQTAIEAWINDHDPATAAELLSLYEDPANLASTYVGFSGTGTLTKLNDYIRIDGPRVWIEMSAQSAGALPNEFHYHTIWRDKLTDYGGEFNSQ